MQAVSSTNIPHWTDIEFRLGVGGSSLAVPKTLIKVPERTLDWNSGKAGPGFVRNLFKKGFVLSQFPRGGLEAESGDDSELSDAELKQYILETGVVLTRII